VDKQCLASPAVELRFLLIPARVPTSTLKFTPQAPSLRAGSCCGTPLLEAPPCISKATAVNKVGFNDIRIEGPGGQRPRQVACTLPTWTAFGLGHHYDLLMHVSSLYQRGNPKFFVTKSQLSTTHNMLG
jgi:hypothetical protein